MTAIDHRYFPHILDLIWLSLDYAGQLAARGVCHEWKEKADRRLRHLVITCFEWPTLRHRFDISTRDLSKPSAPHVWIDQMSHWHRNDDHECDSSWPGEEPFEYSEAQLLTIHLEHRMLDVTEVVDFVGFELGWPHVPPDLSENTFLRSVLIEDDCIVRWFGDPPYFSDFRDFCSYRDPDHRDFPPSLIDVYMFDLEQDKPLHVLQSFELIQRDTCQVVNYFCYRDPTASFPGLGSIWDCLWDRNMCPVIVVLHNRIPEEDRAPPCLDQGLIAAYGDLVHGDSQVTIVGLDEFLEPKEIESYINKVKHKILEGRYVTGDEGDDEWWVPKRSCLNDLCFLTHAEYRERVGEEMYRIDTVR